MDALPISMPAELRNALHAQGGAPLHFLDDETQKVYVLVEEPVSDPIDDDYIRHLLKEALEDEARGDVGPLDIEEIKREGRRILALRQARQANGQG